MTTSQVEPSRRERLRAATVQEMREAAHAILIEEGEAAVTLREVARRMGMTAPALYRYIDSHEDLLAGLAVLCNDDVVAAMEAARDGEPDDNSGRRLIAVTRAFRDWSVTHPAEFSLIFASPRMAQRCDDPELAGASYRFGWTFGQLFLDLIASGSATAWPDEDVDPAFVSQESDLLQALSRQLGPGARWQFVHYWTRVYGTVCMEVYGHLDWAVADPRPVFEYMLRGISADMGLAQAEDDR